MPAVDDMWRGARDAMTVKRVYGDPVQSDGVTLVPAAAVRGGAGGGGEGGPEVAAEAASASSRDRSAPT